MILKFHEPGSWEQTRLGSKGPNTVTSQRIRADKGQEPDPGVQAGGNKSRAGTQAGVRNWESVGRNLGVGRPRLDRKTSVLLSSVLGTERVAGS